MNEKLKIKLILFSTIFIIFLSLSYFLFFDTNSYSVKEPGTETMIGEYFWSNARVSTSDGGPLYLAKMNRFSYLLLKFKEDYNIDCFCQLGHTN